MKNLFKKTGIIKLFCAAVTTIAAMTVLTGRIGAQETDALVRALGGKAAVNGSVVTLNEGVSVRNTVTVPAGVTLDLTADGAGLNLQNNATLTVNGTVNARANGINIERAAVINGNGTINLKSKGHLLIIVGKGRKLTLDGVTLVGIADNDEPLVRAHDGSELVLKSGTITGNTRIGTEWVVGGGVVVSKGTFTMEGGSISGNTCIGRIDWAAGGGVMVQEGKFTMKGGTISGNSTMSNNGGHGGGVMIDNAMFTMTGGTISNNNASGETWATGGGVRVNSQGTFNMEGGTISNNNVSSNGNAFGGGVMAQKWDGPITFTMKGGEISGNTAKAGGGVCLQNGCTFTIEGGTISGNKAADIGGGVRQQEGIFRMKGGAISGNSATSSGGGVCAGDYGTFIMEGGSISGNSAGQGGGVSFRNWDHPASGRTPFSFNMTGGRIQGNADSDGFAKNSGANAAILAISSATMRWGTGGTYSKGGVAQTGGSDIGITDETLIAIPKK